MSTTITCPKCSATFEVGEVMTNQLRNRLRAELEAELGPERSRLAERTAKLEADEAALEKQRSAIDEEVRQRLESERVKVAAQAREKATEELSVELRDREEQIREAQAKIKAAEARELAWRKKERDLQEREDALPAERERVLEESRLRVAAERQELIEQGRKKAADELAARLQERDEELGGLREKLKAAGEQESALRKRQRELEERAEQMQLEIDRKVDAERQLIRDTARKQMGEEYELKLRDEQEKNGALRKQIDELKRRAEQGSQQAQGETLELVIEEALADAFRADRIDEVRKGVHGADVLQQVRTPAGAEAGTILWETKRTKNWQADWLRKARQDQREAGAAISIIVSEVLPADISAFGLVQGVWVCSRACVIPLATALRAGLLEIANARRALEGQHGKMEAVYEYLTGVEFKNRVTGMLEPLIGMRQTLEKEKAATQKNWAARDKQIDQILGGVAFMYGELQGIIGASLPRIEGLELPVPDEAKALPVVAA